MAIAEQNHLSEKTQRKVTKQDIHLLRSADKTRKYEIEQSSFYIGYKLLWILSLFLKGKKFPQGDLIEAQFRAHVFNIVDFVTDEQTLALLLDFDPEALFKTIIYLFSDKPWHYIVRCNKGYNFEFQKPLIEGSGNSGGSSVKRSPEKIQSLLEEEEGEASANTSKLTELAKQILLIFKQAADRRNRKDPAFTQACFLELILRIIVAQDKEDKN